MSRQKQAFYIFLLLSFYTNLAESRQLFKNDKAFQVYNFSPVVNNLELQQSLSQTKLIVIPVLVAIAMYAQKTSLLSMIANYPLTFFATSFFTCNYLVDTLSKYRQINETLTFFLFSQKMNRYMLSVMAIKNTMNQLREIRHVTFDEQLFFNAIQQETGLPIKELETFTFELINSSLNSINNLCIDMNKTDIEEKIYFLFKDKISIEHMLILSKNDPELHVGLVQFYNNPEQEFENMTNKICALLKKHLNCFL